MSTFLELLESAKAQIREVDAAHLQQLVEGGGAVVLDVREPGEWADGTIPGARMISRGFLEMQIERLVPARETSLVLYCESGVRSIFAARSLLELGYSNVSSLQGGIVAWKNAGMPVDHSSQLSQIQRARYSRHIRIPEIAEAGQLRLLESRVLLIGAGGLGSPAAFYLAAAGVGTLGLVDNDIVDRSNLQRQILHTEDRIGSPKVDSAARAIKALNPDVHVEAFNLRLNADNVDEIFSQGWDVVLDGGDNFPTRYLINDACVRHGIPNVHGSVFRFEGQVTTFGKDGPCYRCLYPEAPPPELTPNCQEAGVLGAVPGVVGVLQSVEVLKLLLGLGETLQGRLLLFDAMRTSFRELRMQQDPQCAVCSVQSSSASLTSSIPS